MNTAQENSGPAGDNEESLSWTEKGITETYKDPKSWKDMCQDEGKVHEFELFLQSERKKGKLVLLSMMLLSLIFQGFYLGLLYFCIHEGASMVEEVDHTKTTAQRYSYLLLHRSVILACYVAISVFGALILTISVFGALILITPHCRSASFSTRDKLS